MNTIRTDICVIGAGSGGLSVASGAVQMGAEVVLVEQGEMGGDCLNYGCVPSKALLAAAHSAQQIREAIKFGVTASEPVIDFAAVNDHIHGVIAEIAPHDSQERFESLGAMVLRAHARFTSPHAIVAGDTEVQAKRFVIATGSSPAAPPIPGLDDVDYFTNETMFDLRVRPDHLMIIGGGPIGCEMAQGHRRLGSKVTLLEKFSILPKDDPDMVEIVRAQLIRDGIDLREGVDVTAVTQTADQITLTVDGVDLVASHLLVATGRQPNIDGLDLDAAGVDYSKGGIVVSDRRRTNKGHIYAIGDVTGGHQFTHQANYEAGIVVQNILFRLPARVNNDSLPWVTYTEPPLAQVGLGASELMNIDPKGTVLTSSFEDNDRARATRSTDGLLKVMVDRKGRIRGASIVGHGADELLQPWTLAISQKMNIRAMTGFRAAYPTLGEINKNAAGSYYTSRLYSENTRRLVRLLMKLP